MKQSIQNFKVTIAFGLFASSTGLAVRHIIGYFTTFQCVNSDLRLDCKFQLAQFYTEIAAGIISAFLMFFSCCFNTRGMGLFLFFLNLAPCIMNIVYVCFFYFSNFYDDLGETQRRQVLSFQVLLFCVWMSNVINFFGLHVSPDILLDEEEELNQQKIVQIVKGQQKPLDHRMINPNIRKQFRQRIQRRTFTKNGRSSTSISKITPKIKEQEQEDSIHLSSQQEKNYNQDSQEGLKSINTQNQKIQRSRSPHLKVNVVDQNGRQVRSGTSSLLRKQSSNNPSIQRSLSSRSHKKKPI